MQISRIEFRALWKALGYKYDTIAQELQAHFKGREGLSATNLHDKTFDEPDAKLPEDISTYVLSLEPVDGKGNKELYELYRRGLGYLKGDSLGYVDPGRVAGAVVERFPAGELAKAVAAQFPTETLASSIAAKLPTPSAPPPVDSRELTALSGKMDQANEKADQTHGKLVDANLRLDTVHATQHETNARLDKLTWAVLGAGAFIGTGLVAAVALLLWHHASAPARLALTMWGSNVVVLGNLVDRGQLMESSTQTWFNPGIAGDVGTRKTGRPMPHQPLPNQMVGTCPAGATSLNGACWVKVADQQAPCFPGFFSHGSACYLPVWNTPVPTSPVGGEAAQ